MSDAPGTVSEVARHSACNGMVATGAPPMSWFGVACTFHRDRRNDVGELGALFSAHTPTAGA